MGIYMNVNGEMIKKKEKEFFMEKMVMYLKESIKMKY